MFITFEGTEGAGKTTIMALVAQNLAKAGHATLLTREPGGTPLGLKLREILLATNDSPVAPDAELFLFLADRAQHVAQTIRPAIANGKIVLCDRFEDSTIAYQGYGRGIDLTALRFACALAGERLMPDLTLLLELPVETGLERAAARNSQNRELLAQSRFDSEAAAFHHRVHRGFLALAEENPERIRLIDASRPVSEVLEECILAIQPKLPK